MFEAQIAQNTDAGTALNFQAQKSVAGTDYNVWSVSSTPPDCHSHLRQMMPVVDEVRTKTNERVRLPRLKSTRSAHVVFG